MKLAGYILSVYLLLLATVPCCAFDNCPDDKTEQSGKHEPGDEDCGTCSPFFSCEGCATATIAWEPTQFNFKMQIPSRIYTFYQVPSLPKIQHDFWQPPKLG